MDVKANSIISGRFTFWKKIEIVKTPRNCPETDVRLKSLNFMNNIVAKKELNDKNAEGIFLTRDGYLAEGLTSNLFFVKDNILYTPSVDIGILNGITRQFVLNLSRKLKITIAEGFLRRKTYSRQMKYF
ncbi:aminotransferase class IV [Tepidibacillus marianensis]|uniref:aminotransferase class IV n=1 Tax=Tepidibacillus marianensis TaxID=3131995 RepID=UPI0030D501AF